VSRALPSEDFSHRGKVGEAVTELTPPPHPLIHVNPPGVAGRRLAGSSMFIFLNFLKAATVKRNVPPPLLLRLIIVHQANHVVEREHCRLACCSPATV